MLKRLAERFISSRLSFPNGGKHGKLNQLLGVSKFDGSSLIKELSVNSEALGGLRSLVLHGEKDEVIPFENAKLINSGLVNGKEENAANHEIITGEEWGHFFWINDALETLKAIDSFLSKPSRAER